ncbi:class I SAM-dependent methyltransferase [Nocardia sp. NPDC059091]|uniref:class I SAM-dependent methyltransferase n=1 Tax=unclassified Nocardia TaxID=2637762 RepID=UPI0036CD3B4C
MSATETPRARCDRARRRLLAAARQRYAEDRLADAVSAGTRQVVVFGTALDTFAAHNPYPGLHVYRATAEDFGSSAATTDFGRSHPAASRNDAASGARVAEIPRHTPGFRPEQSAFVIVLADPRSEDPGTRAGVGEAAAREAADFARRASGFDGLHGVPGMRRRRIGGGSLGSGGVTHCQDRAVESVLRMLSECPGGAEIVFDMPPEASTGIERLLRDTGWVVLADLTAGALASRYLDVAPGPDYSVEPRVVWARVGNNAGRLPDSLPAE